MGDDSVGLSDWSLWLKLWPILVFVPLIAGVIQFGCVIAAAAVASQRRWIPIALAGVAMSAFAFLTVAHNFPDA